jgi:hypothetical protein
MKVENEIHHHHCSTCACTLGCHEEHCAEEESGTEPDRPMREALSGAEKWGPQAGWQCSLCRFGSGILEADDFDHGDEERLVELSGAALIHYLLRLRQRGYFRCVENACGGEVCQRCGEIGFWFAPTSLHPIHGPEGYICEGCWHHKPGDTVESPYCEFCRKEIHGIERYKGRVWACSWCIDVFRLQGWAHAIPEITRDLVQRRYWQEYDRQLAESPIPPGRGKVLKIGPNQLSLIRALNRAPEQRFRSLSQWFLSTPEAYRSCRETLRQSCWRVVSHGWATVQRAGSGFESTITDKGRSVADGQIPFRVLRRSCNERP